MSHTFLVQLVIYMQYSIFLGPSSPVPDAAGGLKPAVSGIGGSTQGAELDLFILAVSLWLYCVLSWGKMCKKMINYDWSQSSELIQFLKITTTYLPYIFHLFGDEREEKLFNSVL